MIDVLMTHSYFLRFDRKQWNLSQPYAPLGTLYASSVLREAGFKIALFDPMLAESESDLERYIVHYTPGIVAIYDDSFNYLTKMCLERMRIAAFRMMRIARRHGCQVIVSSSDSADHAGEYLEQGADYVIIGEGEYTLLDLTKKIVRGEGGGNSGIRGISYLERGKVIFTGPRSPTSTPDAIPFPAWDLVDVDSYKQLWSKSGFFSMNVVTTRGCPYGCNWCAKPIYGRVYNSRSPANVVMELAMLGKMFNPDHIWFCDDIFGLKRGWLAEFAAEVQRAGLNIRYKCLSRPDLLIRENSFDLLAKSGCETVWIGAESGSQKILDAMEKGTNVEQIKLATRQLRGRGIRVGYFLQFGYPGESYEDIRMTLSMLKEEMPDEIGVSVSYPLPNTEFHQMVKDAIGKRTNWFDSDDLRMLFPGEYKPVFYKLLHRAIHKMHRLRRISGRMEKWGFRTAAVFVFNIFTLPFYLAAMQLNRSRNPARVSIKVRQP